MNLLKIQNELRSVPDEALVGYVQNPQPHVPTYLALSELERRQNMRKKAGQGEAPSSSVAEDVVSEEQNKAPLGGLAGMMQGAQPQQDTRESGLAAMDVGNAVPQEYANGGIVAFAKGGPSYDYSLPMEDEDMASSDFMRKYQQMLGQNQGLIDIQDRLAKQEERAQQEMSTAPWMSLARAGLAIAGGKSPFALQNIGEGAQEGLKDYIAAKDRFQQANDRYLDARSRLAQADRAERIGMVSGALSAEEKAAARNATRQANALEAQAAMDRQAAANATQLKVAQIQAARNSDYESYLAGVRNDPDFYKVVKGPDGKPTRVLDMAKVQSNYKSLTSGKTSTDIQEKLIEAWSADFKLRKQYPNVGDYVNAVMKTLGGSSSVSDPSVVSKTKSGKSYQILSQ